MPINWSKSRDEDFSNNTNASQPSHTHIFVDHTPDHPLPPSHRPTSHHTSSHHASHDRAPGDRAVADRPQPISGSHPARADDFSSCLDNPSLDDEDRSSLENQQQNNQDLTFSNTIALPSSVFSPPVRVSSPQARVSSPQHDVMSPRVGVASPTPYFLPMVYNMTAPAGSFVATPPVASSAMRCPFTEARRIVVGSRPASPDTWMESKLDAETTEGGSSPTTASGRENIYSRKLGSGAAQTLNVSPGVGVEGLNVSLSPSMMNTSPPHLLLPHTATSQRLLGYLGAPMSFSPSSMNRSIVNLQASQSRAALLQPEISGEDTWRQNGWRGAYREWKRGGQEWTRRCQDWVWAWKRRSEEAGERKSMESERVRLRKSRRFWILLTALIFLAFNALFLISFYVIVPYFANKLIYNVKYLIHQLCTHLPVYAHICLSIHTPDSLCTHLDVYAHT